MNEIIKADLSSNVDAQAIVYLLNEYSKDEMGGGVELSEYTKNNLINELKARSNCHIILAYVDRKPAGLAINFEGFSTFACRPTVNIHDLTVASEFRGLGLSKALLLKSEEIAIAKGCCKLTLEVLEGNKLAQTVYRNFGFTGYELDPEMGRAMFYEKKLSAT